MADSEVRQRAPRPTGKVVSSESEQDINEDTFVHLNNFVWTSAFLIERQIFKNSPYFFFQKKIQNCRARGRPGAKHRQHGRAGRRDAAKRAAKVGFSALQFSKMHTLKQGFSSVLQVAQLCGSLHFHMDHDHRLCLYCVFGPASAHGFGTFSVFWFCVL